MQTSLRILDNSPVPLDGRHDQIWRLVLERVFSDATCSGVGHLQLLLPEGSKQEELPFRTQLAEELSGQGTAVAWLVSRPPRDVDADKLYWLRRSPWSSRAAAGILGIEWRLIERWDLAPWPTRVLGVLLRLSRWSHRPDWEDRILFALKTRWVATRPTWGACRLEVWERCRPAGQQQTSPL